MEEYSPSGYFWGDLEFPNINPAGNMVVFWKSPDNQTTSVLMVQRPGDVEYQKNMWVFPGGFCPPLEGNRAWAPRFEDPFAVAKSRLLSQTGIALPPKTQIEETDPLENPLGKTSYPSDNVFAAVLTGERPTPIAGKKVQAVEWKRLPELFAQKDIFGFRHYRLLEMACEACVEKGIPQPPEEKKVIRWCGNQKGYPFQDGLPSTPASARAPAPNVPLLLFLCKNPGAGNAPDKGTPFSPARGAI